MGIATAAEQAVDGLLNTFVTTKSAALSAMLAPLALTGVTIYIIVMGWAIMRGEAQDSFHTFLWKSFKIAFICGIALSAGEYQGSVVDGVTGIQGAITSVFGAGTLGGVIDNALGPYEDLGQQIWSEAVTGFMPNFALVAAAGFVSVAQFFITLVALGMYLLAKIALALVLAVGPVFIFCAMFPATQRFTESWIAQAMQFTLLNALLAAAISMLYDVSSEFAAHVGTGFGDTAVIKDTLALLGISAGLCVVVLNIQGIAGALSGGVGLQGIGREIGRKALELMNRGGGGGKRDGGSMEGGRTTGQPHPASSGGTASTPLYQRNVLDNIRKASTR